VSGVWSTASFAGAVGGPKNLTTEVLRHEADRYQVSFLASQPAIVRIRGDGNTVVYSHYTIETN
jgi:hypothetical protein